MFRGEDECVVEGHGGDATAAFFAKMGTGVVNQDATHELSGDSEEMGATLPLDGVLANEFEIGLVNKGGGLKGVVGALAAEVGPGQAFELAVHEGDKLVGSKGIA